MSKARPIDLYDHFVLDMDGVIYLGNRPIATAVRFLGLLRKEGKAVLFLTNNSMQGVEHYRRKLSGMNIAARRDEILTSSMVMRDYLSDFANQAGKTVMVIGGRALESEMARVPLTVLKGDEGRRAQVVVAGWDTRLTYDKLKNACLAIENGAEFYATNDDATYPAPDGKWPGAGSIIAALREATGVKPVIIGKPHRPMMEAALRRLTCPRSRALIIGDRLDTDILGGKRVGMATCLVLTGVSSTRDLEEARFKPDMVVDDLMRLAEEIHDPPEG
jgi:4-nitrophenyl phosphatase